MLLAKLRETHYTGMWLFDVLEQKEQTKGKNALSNKVKNIWLKSSKSNTKDMFENQIVSVPRGT